MRRIGKAAACVAMMLAMPAIAAKPVGARPAANPGEWVTPDDYPPVALRQNQHGTTGFRVDIAADGSVAGCTVVASSGYPVLDEASCRLVTARARFTPARDRRGRPIPATYSSAVRWQIPQTQQMPPRQTCLSDPSGDIRVATPVGCY